MAAWLVLDKQEECAALVNTSSLLFFTLHIESGLLPQCPVRSPHLTVTNGSRNWCRRKSDTGQISQRCMKLIQRIPSHSNPTDNLPLLLCRPDMVVLLRLRLRGSLAGAEAGLDAPVVRILNFFGWCLTVSISSKMAMLGEGWPRSPRPKLIPSTCSAWSSLSRSGLQPGLGKSRVTWRESADCLNISRFS